MVFTSKPTFLPWSLLDYLSLLDTLSDHVFMYVGLFVYSAVVFHVFMFYVGLLTLCAVVFFSVTFY